MEKIEQGIMGGVGGRWGKGGMLVYVAFPALSWAVGSNVWLRLLSLENLICLISVCWITDEMNFFMRRQIGGEKGEREGESRNNEISFRMTKLGLFLNYHGHMYEPERIGS